MCHCCLSFLNTLQSTGYSGVEKQDMNNAEQKYGEAQRHVEWRHEERKHVKQIRKDHMKVSGHKDHMKVSGR